MQLFGMNIWSLNTETVVYCSCLVQRIRMTSKLLIKQVDKKKQTC